MSEPANSEKISSESEKPVSISISDEVKFPPFPEPTDEDFEEDISEEERNFYKTKFKDLNVIKTLRLHCTACDRHLGCSARNENRMRVHPMLRTLMCHTCHTFYNSGEFEKGDDGSELYCRWCGQGGQVYCCSNCPHVFCAKCIKRNLGTPKIKEIENTDDWKCFKCNSKCLWDLRAMCWALLRYCDLKNKITYKTQDPQLKGAYQKHCALDHSECCKNKTKRRERQQEPKKKDLKEENSAKKSLSAAQVISKIPPTIQVKKFASIHSEDMAKDKKSQKRSLSPKSKPIYMDPQLVAQNSKLLTAINLPSMPKRIRMPNTPMTNTIRFQNDKNVLHTPFTRIRPKQPQFPIPILASQFNGLNTANLNMLPNDNINLSLESLTQDLDMAAVAAMNNTGNNDVVCTPDFPLEPLCEVTEDNNDDDVQCITPGPIAAPKISNPQHLVTRSGNLLQEMTNENIIQMTENDVTVNTATGGLKFRVDPQTLSSNKMYRLPDGRIFAINVNPNMPGGYSATIVAVTESPTGKITVPKGAVYAAKLNAVTSGKSCTPPPLKLITTSNTNSRNVQQIKTSTPKLSKATRTTTTSRECDLKVPVEWYRYNLIDAVDTLEYSLSRLNKLKKEATTIHLRTRTVNEMRNLHQTLDRLLHTSSSRFDEIRDSLNKGLKRYLIKKTGNVNISDEEDDDVEILPDIDDNEDPIFIDENSLESNAISNENQEVDLTGHVSSDHNDSSEKSGEKHDSLLKSSEVDALDTTQVTDKNVLSGNDAETPEKDNRNVLTNITECNSHKNYVGNRDDNDCDQDRDEVEEKNEANATEETHTKLRDSSDKIEINGDQENLRTVSTELEENKTKERLLEDIDCDKDDEKLDLKDESNVNNTKKQDSDLSEELIETLLKDDDGVKDNDNKSNADIDIKEDM